MDMTLPFTPYSTIKRMYGTSSPAPTIFPEEDRDRIASYIKYDEFYWNDDSQFVLRVLAGEYPLYIPNARTVVDTTAHFLLKGLTVGVEQPETHTELNTALKAFLRREMFYSRFHIAKHAGVARGDFVLHITADPNMPAGSRLSLNSVDPSTVLPIYDDDDICKLLRVHLVDVYKEPNPIANQVPKELVHKLTYEYDDKGRVVRSEGVYELDPKWYGPTPKLVKTIYKKAPLPAEITTIPVYWFQNLSWEGQQFGSSELRGLEKIIQGVSQAATDQEVSLALEGLGVYATDGGAPVDERGEEVDWEVSPGKVMEVPSGAYFRRVEGLSTLKPSMDHINYVESKLREASGLSDVALGRIDVQTAQSGIALAIKFMPTLAKLEQRDLAGVDRLNQLFFDWKTWYAVYEGSLLEGEITAEIGDKLPLNNAERVNELNNMFDRKIISAKYYREEMAKLGYIFPDDIEQEILDENQKKLEQMQMFQGEGVSPNGQVPPPPGKGGNGTLPAKPNQSNNKGKVNESDGTERGQTIARQTKK